MRQSDEQFEQRMCEQDYYNEHDFDDEGKLVDEAHEELEADVYGTRDGYCVHGVYVGGCGPDYMCGLCEMGCFDQEEVTRYYLTITGTGVEGRKIEYVSGQYSRAEAERAASDWLDMIEQTNFNPMVCISEYNEMVWTNGEDN